MKNPPIGKSDDLWLSTFRKISILKGGVIMTTAIRLLEDIEVDLTNIVMNEEALRHVTLMPRLWLYASAMGPDRWNAAAHVLSVVTTVNPHVAPQLFFVTTDVFGLLDSAGLQKLRSADYTQPCLMETYRRYLEDYPDVAPCRPQVDLIAAVPTTLKLTPNDATNLRTAGFRPAVYITNVNDISKTALQRGVGIVLDIPLNAVVQPLSPPLEDAALFLTIAVLSNHHFIIWRHRDIESQFRKFIRSLPA